MEAFFDELGAIVLKRWKQQNFSLAKFPDIARLALEEKPPAKKVKMASLTRDFLLNEDQPRQTDSPFGEPELVIYNHPRFYIQLLFWMDGTTAIHQHEFSGAFHVMHGSSIHAQYEFKNPRPITPFIRIGNLRLKKMEILEAGQTVPIISGQRDIHSLFHLDSPSVTVVVRTQHDPGTGPQFNYLPPHVAVDPHFSYPLMMRRKQLLDVLGQTDETAYAKLVMEMIADLDFERGFSLLHHCVESLQHLGQWELAMGVFAKKHGDLAAGVAATLNEDVRRSAIKSMRSAILEPEHRFFLALLMNAPTRDNLLALVAQRFVKDEPVDVVLRWAEELTEISDAGVTILDALFPYSMEIPLEDQKDLFLAAFGYFFKRSRKPATPMRHLSSAELKQLRSAFQASALGLLIT